MYLVALRIPPGWAVTYNQFYEAKPIINGDTGYMENWSLFSNRLLNIHLLPRQSSALNHQHSLQIEVAWLPEGDPTGAYHATLVANTSRETWQELLHFSHAESTPIVDRISEWMEQVNQYRWGAVHQGKDEFSIFMKWFLDGAAD